MDGPDRRRRLTRSNKALFLERGCEASRIEPELWARAYQFAVPSREAEARAMPAELVGGRLEPAACLAPAA
jgi:hypothetical protein